MSKREIWLETNRRAILVGLIPAALATTLLVAWACLTNLWSVRILACGIAVPLAVVTVLLAWWLRVPRLAYRDGMLQVYLRGFDVLEVPIEHVECFFRGQGESLVGRAAADAVQPPQATTIVVRLAEAAHDFQRREVRRELGGWCEGYITIRGTWCEPIDADLLTRLNRRLVEVHREHTS
jgi:hypothetical protein